MLEPAQGVFHIDHGVIDQLAHGNRDPAQRHDVDRQPQVVKNQHRRRQRKRNRSQRDQGRARREQKRKQDDRHHDGPVAQRLGHVAGGGADEVGLAKQDLGRSQPGRSARVELGQRSFDLLGQAQRVGTGLLLYAHHHRRGGVEAGVAALHAGGKAHVRDLLQQDRAPVAPGHRQALQVFDAVAAPDVADQVLAAVEVDEAAAGVACKAAQRGLDLLQAHPRLRHAHGIGLDPQLAHLAANRDHLRHAGDGQQAWAQHEVGVLAR